MTKAKCPRTDKNFKKYWDLFLPDIESRENFKLNHLQQLELLCDLYVEYHSLSQFIKKNGYSFITGGRYGETSRAHAEVQIRIKVLMEIRNYSKLLNLSVAKDVTPVGDSEEEWN